MVDKHNDGKIEQKDIQTHRQTYRHTERLKDREIFSAYICCICIVPIDLKGDWHVLKRPDWSCCTRIQNEEKN